MYSNISLYVCDFITLNLAIILTFFLVKSWFLALLDQLLVYTSSEFLDFILVRRIFSSYNSDISFTFIFDMSQDVDVLYTLFILLSFCYCVLTSWVRRLHIMMFVKHVPGLSLQIVENGKSSIKNYLQMNCKLEIFVQVRPFVSVSVNWGTLFCCF